MIIAIYTEMRGLQCTRDRVAAMDHRVTDQLVVGVLATFRLLLDYERYIGVCGYSTFFSHSYS